MIDNRYHWWHVTAASLDDALAIYRKAFPWFPPRGVRNGNVFSFKMSYRRVW